MEITAEMVLDIAKIKASISEVDKRLNGLATSGARSAARMNAAVTTQTQRSISGAAQGVQSAAGRAAQIAAAPLGGIQRAVSGIAATVGGAINSLSSLARQMGVVGGAAIGAAAGISGIVAAVSLIETADYEDRLLSAQVFARSAEKGLRIMQETAEFNKITPFDAEALETAVVGLLSAGVAADEVVATMREIASISRDGEALAGLSTAFGKGFAKTKFDLEQINQFLERQVNLIPAMAKAMGTSQAGVFEAISKGAITPDIMRAAFRELISEGGQFFGLMERRSQTLNGLWSTLVSNIQLTRRAGFLESMEAAKDIVREMIDAVDRGSPIAAKFGTELAKSLDAALATWRVLTRDDDFALGFEVAINRGVAAVQNAGTVVASVFGEVIVLMGREMASTATVFGLAIGHYAEAAGHYFVAALWAGFKGLLDYLQTGFLDVMAAILSGDAKAIAQAGLNVEREVGAAKGRGSAATFVAGLEIAKGFEILPRELAEMIKALPKAIETGMATGRAAATIEPNQAAGEADLFRRIAEEMDAILKARQAREAANPINPKQDPGTGITTADPSQADGAQGEEKGTTVTKARLPGQFQAAVNRIAGRTTNDLVLVEAQLQTRQQRKANQLLEMILAKMGDDIEIPGIGRFSKK